MNQNVCANDLEIISHLENAGARVVEKNEGLTVYSTRSEELILIAAQLERMIELEAPWNASAPELAGPELRHLNGHKNLRKLDVTNMPISGEHLSVIATLPKLEVLRCTPKDKFDEAMMAISRCKELRVLSLAGCNLPDKSIEKLRTLSKLEELILSENPISSGIAVVASMTHLRKLCLEKSLVDDKALASLEGLTELEKLFVGSPRLTDEGFAHIRKCSKLDTLSVDSPHLTRACAQDLIELPRLASLYLGETWPDATMLTVLGKAKSLRSIAFRADGVTGKARKQFESLLPKCDFIWFEYPDEKKSK